MMVKTIGVDFDGVIHDYKEGWKDGSIYGAFVPGAKEALTSLMENNAVFVFTARDTRQVADWLFERGFSVAADTRRQRSSKFWNHQDLLLVTNIKYPAVAYIDDRGIRFESWSQTRSALAELAGVA